MQKTSTKKQFVVPNPLGLHARAASKLVKVGVQFDSTIEVHGKNGQSANGKSVIDLLTLGAEQGHKLTIVINGNDAHDAMQAIDELFADNLGD